MHDVTIVITAHKDKKQLFNILDNAHEQSVRAKEILVVVSDIDTSDLPLENLYRQVNYEDWGHSKRRLGIEKATSEFITFWNADDVYDRQFIEKMYQDADFVYCNYKNKHGDTVEAQPSKGSSTSGNFIVRTSLAKQIGWNGSHYEADGDFIDSVAAQAKNIIHVKEVLYSHQ